MRFRPCIDIHNGKVKQIVGGSLKDEGDCAKENFASIYDADYFAEMYKRNGLRGGHVILLNPPSSEYYEAALRQARAALMAYPLGLQIGGGIHADNAESFLEMGASHVIVTSYVFKDGRIRWENLERLRKAVGKEHVVIDLSCRKKEGEYYIVTDRWQKFTEVEGRSCGVDERLSGLLGSYSGAPVTYAGGIGSLADLNRFRDVTGGKIDFTIGSALDIFGGKIPFEVVKDIRGCE